MFLSSGPVFLRRGSNVVDLGLDLHVYMYNASLKLRKT